MSHGPALWIGDRVRGTNRYTGDLVTGTLTSKETSELDGREYAVVEQQAGWGPQTILAADLTGPRRCYRPATDNWRGGGAGTCTNCGRPVYANGPYDTDRLTHDPQRPASRYR